MPKKTKAFSHEEYYEKNKQKINDRKKERYLTDASYRESIRNSAAKSYARKRGVDSVERVSAGVYKINGVDYYSVSYIARKTGVSTQLINYYLVNGILPEPRKIPNYTKRLFSYSLTAAITQAIDMYLSKRISGVKDIKETVRTIMGDQYKEETQNVTYK